MPIFVVNSEVDARGARVPVNQPPEGWVGNLYEKTGNVFKFLLVTEADISGQAGVFGPVSYDDVQAAIDADGGTLRGWKIDGLPNFSVNGYQPRVWLSHTTDAVLS